MAVDDSEFLAVVVANADKCKLIHTATFHILPIVLEQVLKSIGKTATFSGRVAVHRADHFGSVATSARWCGVGSGEIEVGAVALEAQDRANTTYPLGRRVGFADNLAVAAACRHFDTSVTG